MGSDIARKGLLHNVNGAPNILYKKNSTSLLRECSVVNSPG